MSRSTRLGLAWPGAAAFRRRAFRSLWLGQALAQVTDWALLVGLMVLAYERTGGGAAVAFLLLARVLPRLALLPVAGIRAAWLARPWVLASCDLARAALTVALLPLVAAPDLWPVYAVVLIAQAFALLAAGARDALLPALVPRGELGAANLVNRLTCQYAFVVGAVLGSLALALGSVRVAIILHAGALLLAALPAWLLRPIGAAPPDVHSTVLRPGLAPVPPFREALAVVAASPPLRMVFGGLFLGAAISLHLQVTLLVVLVDRLGRPTAALGLLLAIVGLGVLAGALPIVRVVTRFPTVPLVAALVAGLAAGKALIGGVTSPVLVAGALFGVGVLAIANELVAAATVQRLVPSRVLDQVSGLLAWVATLGQVIGALAGGLAAWLLDLPRSLLAASGVYLLILAALFLVSRAKPPVAVAAGEPAEPVAAATRR